MRNIGNKVSYCRFNFWSLYLISDVQSEALIKSPRSTNLPRSLSQSNIKRYTISCVNNYHINVIKKYLKIISVFYATFSHISRYSRALLSSGIISISSRIIIKRNNIAVKSASWDPQQFAGANFDKSTLRPTIRLQALFHLFAFVKRDVDYVNSSIHRVEHSTRGVQHWHITSQYPRYRDDKYKSILYRCN